MLAMVVNDDAGHLIPSGVLQSIASMLAPTGGASLFQIDLRIILTPKRADRIPLDILARQREGRRVGQR